VRSRLDWQDALGLELTDPGFDFSVLSEFRTRLVTGKAEQKLLERLLDAFKARGWLKAGGQQRTDSTPSLAASRTLNRLEGLGETLRAALNALATVAPEWLQAWVPPVWFERYGYVVEEYRLPKGVEARKVYAETIATDGIAVVRDTLVRHNAHRTAPATSHRAFASNVGASVLCQRGSSAAASCERSTACW